ncbi:hypothetical protein MNBD_GAMMA18-763 [hydrothermal vent metagenome]|uniref:Uncharacterized protein n=1 Tax=hydrothermal vent metagenome TaxID=652676 RepID=A0A3B0ZTB7_9ZZZZ
MRIGDNNLNLYSLAQQRPTVPKPVADLPQSAQAAPLPVVLPTAVEPVSDVKKQLLLQHYLPQDSLNSDASVYPQQRAVEAYRQQAQQSELQQLQAILGVDEYA